MSFTFKSKLGKLKMGSTPTLTLLDTTSSLNFASLNITNSLILNYAGAGILHADGTGSVTSSLLATTDIANLAVSSEKLQTSIFLSGVPTTTTANDGTNTTQIATTAFVQNTITNVLGNAPATLNTLKELADAIGNDANFVSNIGIDIAGKVSLNGNESINGTKTFTSLPILSSFTQAGVLHNNSNGILSTNLIQTADIDNNTINSDKLKTNSVITDKIALGAVTFDKIGVGAVVNATIANGAITFDKIGVGAVVNATIANGAITFDKIGVGAVTFDKIGPGAIKNIHIDNNAINIQNLTDKCVINEKIAHGAVKTKTLDPNLILPFKTTLEIFDGPEDEAEIGQQSLVTVGLLTSNKPLASPQGFFHITEEMVTPVTNGNSVYVIGDYIKYILETNADIYLPAITHEGMFFSITNKIDNPMNNLMIIRTNNANELMHNITLAPYEGDPELEIDNHRTFDVISQITRGVKSWQARFF